MRRVRVHAAPASPLATSDAGPGSESGITTKAGQDGDHDSLAALPLHPLHELDVPMTMRVLRFEVELEMKGALDDPRLGIARAIRLLLTRACGYAALTEGEAGSFEAAVADALRRVYAWAFRALDAAIAGEPVPPPSRRVEALLFEITETCNARVAFDPTIARLHSIVLDLAMAAHAFETGRSGR